MYYIPTNRQNAINFVELSMQLSMGNTLNSGAGIVIANLPEKTKEKFY